MPLIVVCCVCGIPASGKSFFCSSLCPGGSRENAAWRSIHIEYDKLVQEQQVEICSDRPEAGVEAWNRARRCGLEQVQKFVEMALDDHEAQNLVILVDDNLFYTSMRHPFLQLARKYCVGFSQVCLTVDLSLALKLNRGRKGSAVVADSVVESMYSRMEPPMPGPHALFLVLTSVNSRLELRAQQEPDISSSNVKMGASFLTMKPCGRGTCITQAFWGLITRAGLEPEKDQHGKIESNISLSRRATQCSDTHQLDLAIRAAINNFISAVPIDSKRDAAAHCRTLKKIFLAKSVSGRTLEAFLAELRKWQSHNYSE